MDYKKDYSSLRTNCQTGVIQADSGEGIHAAEWWNGEGIDFSFDTKENSNIVTKRIELHIDEIARLVTISIAMGFVDIDECTKNATEMKKQTRKEKKLIKRMRKDKTHELS